MPRPTHSPLATGSLLLALAACTGSATAQVPAAADAAPPIRLQYTSAIDGYKPYADAPVQPWRESNDQAGRIGGWRAYAKEIQGAAPAKDAAVTDPHTGHHPGAKP